MEIQKILDVATDALESVKAESISVMDVEHLTDLMSHVIVCTATSTTHAKSLAQKLQKSAKENHIEILGIEGQDKSDWILVDLGDVVVHIMLKETRDFYQLEKLWDIKPSTRQTNE
ncbi:ribosome silencing factor [Facilibium subflavum]|uniref:ribosome silencing factor n=1 Tax=Facilibium subflavum TaxID=2219058 RepID=UPI000E65B8B1|nr:ribosome silencing factor [Facilibium subflavum]